MKEAVFAISLISLLSFVLMSQAHGQAQRWGIWPDLFFDEYVADDPKVSEMNQEIAEDTPEDMIPSWVHELLQRLASEYPEHSLATVLVVRISDQRLYLVQEEKPLKVFPVSTSQYGIGNQQGSYQTPLGVHQIRQKIGANQPLGAVFRGRIPTGEIAPILTEPKRSTRDNITTRIMWLEGLEEGVNRGEGIGSFERYIYIHGTDEEGLIGTPASDGCVRMRNNDVIDLYNKTSAGTLVVIKP